MKVEKRFESDLKPGDILLYSGKSIWSFFIKIKTWSRFSHVELYLGNGKTATSREGEGIKDFDFTDEDLAVVLRPITEGFGLSIDEAIKFHQSCIGQKYDYWGLARFFRLGKQSLDKAFCSEHCTRVARRIKVFLNEEKTAWRYFQPFAERYDADLVSPGMFWSSPNYEIVFDSSES